MEKSDPSALLKQQIRVKETELRSEEVSLKEHIRLTGESLKPINIVKSLFKEAVSDHGIKPDVMDAAMGFTSGFVAKKIFTGKSRNLLRNFGGLILETAIASGVMRNANEIKSVAAFVVKKMMNRHRASEKEKAGSNHTSPV